MSATDCRLLARAVPLPAKTKQPSADCNNASDDATIIDSLVTRLEASVSMGTAAKKAGSIGNNSDASTRNKRAEECLSPADHLALQSLRSSALARKTNTTSKFSRDCRSLFADLMFGEEQQQKRQSAAGKDEKRREGLLKKEDKTMNEKSDVVKTDSVDLGASTTTIEELVEEEGGKEKERKTTTKKANDLTQKQIAGLQKGERAISAEKEKAKEEEENEEEEVGESAGNELKLAKKLLGEGKKEKKEWSDKKGKEEEGRDLANENGLLLVLAEAGKLLREVGANDKNEVKVGEKEEGPKLGKEEKEEEKEEEEERDKEPAEGELIARGPVRANFIVHGGAHPPFHHHHHPYAQPAAIHGGVHQQQQQHAQIQQHPQLLIQHHQLPGSNNSNGCSVVGADNMSSSSSSFPSTVFPTSTSSSSASSSTPSPQQMPPQMAVAFNATAPQTMLLDQSGLNPAAPFGYGYDCGLPSSNWSVGGWSVGGGSDSAVSSPSATPDSIGTTIGIMSPGASSERSELPDSLSDFILEYSRRYSPILSRKVSISEGASTTHCSTAGDNANVGITNGSESPFSAPQSSPAAPRSGAYGVGPQTPPIAHLIPQSMMAGAKMPGGENTRQAKERLRALVRSEDMDSAWAWTCKCIQRHPGALTFQDADRDTLLHIVTSHNDLAKIYALVEQMLKMESNGNGNNDGTPSFDVPNAVGETPLMVAVQKGQAEVVDYLLEAGASPNAQSTRMERDMPLHYAASRGMTNIVRVLCADPRTNLNAQNGMCLSALLCAFKSHGSLLEEERESRVCNLGVAELLLRVGADPLQVDATNGRTLAHFAVDRMDEQLLELLRTHVDEQQLAELVNRPDFCGETPMRMLEEKEVVIGPECGEGGRRIEEGEEEEVEKEEEEEDEGKGTRKGNNAAAESAAIEKKARLCLALITCGAETNAEGEMSAAASVRASGGSSDGW